jgi:hypothetical protein
MGTICRAYVCVHVCDAQCVNGLTIAILCPLSTALVSECVREREPERHRSPGERDSERALRELRESSVHTLVLDVLLLAFKVHSLCVDTNRCTTQSIVSTIHTNYHSIKTFI